MGLLAGCTASDDARVRRNVRGAREEISQGIDQARQAAADAALEGKVKQYLSARKGLDTRAINVEANGNVITLKGEVADPEQARIAQQAATEVEGVESVINQLTMRVPATGTSASPPGPPASHPPEGR